MSVSVWHWQMVIVLGLVLLATKVLSAPPSVTDDQMLKEDNVAEKRGGARAFRGSNGYLSSAKRFSEGSPYYFLAKRGGGRAFHSSQRGDPWGSGGFSGFRLERRGGGRAFAGDWNGDALARYYDSPYLYKRSLDSYNYLPINRYF